MLLKLKVYYVINESEWAVYSHGFRRCSVCCFQTERILSLYTLNLDHYRDNLGFMFIGFAGVDEKTSFKYQSGACPVENKAAVA